MTLALPERTAPAPAVQHRNGALSLATMTPQEAWKFADVLAGSALLPKDYQNTASLLWALEYGRAIGLDVITTTQSIHVIKGKATASADLMASLTRRAGHRMRITSDDQRAEVTIFRADDPEFPFVAAWDLNKARQARLLNKDTWQQFPGAMLRARAISECVRMACPEVLHGAIYTPEEIGATVDAEGAPVVEVRRAEPGPDEWSTPAPAPVVEPVPQPAAELPPQRDFLAEAMANTDGAALIAIAQAAAEAGAPPEYLGWIDDIHEAQQLRDVASVRDLYTKVKAEGAPAEHLARIAHIGQSKPAAAPVPTPSTAESGTTAAAATGRASGDAVGDKSAGQSEGEIVADTVQARDEMFRAARDAGLTPSEASDTFRSHYGVDVVYATAEQLREQAATLRQIAGAL